VTGYAKAETAAAVAATDTVNQAIGKLEKALDGKQAAGSYASATQGGKADSAIQGVKVNGSALTKDANNVVDVTVPTTASDVGAVPAAQGSTSANKAVITNASGNVTTGTIATGMIADGAVTTDKLGANAVTSAKISDGTIVNADISSSAAIEQAKIANLTTDLANAQNKIPYGSENSTTLVSIWVE
jgi:hypothetical protein